MAHHWTLPALPFRWLQGSQRPAGWLSLGLLSLGLLGALAACSIDHRDVQTATAAEEPAPGGSPSADLGTSVDSECVGCTQALCAPGQGSCASSLARVECTAEGGWSSPIPCDYLCRVDRCAGECVPGAASCASSTQRRRCSGAGEWLPGETCANACVAGQCGGECVPGAQRCASETEVQTCTEAGTWGAATACNSGCSGQGCLATCSPGTSECFSASQVRFCNEQGQWQTPLSCPTSCAGGGCQGECAPASVRCNPDTLAPERCDAAGTWQAAPAAVAARCGEVCTSLETDPSHCGSCGHDCQGGECIAGRCQPVILGTGLGDPGSVALSETEVFLRDGAGASARIVAFPKSGGALRVVTAADGSAAGPAIGGDQLYFATRAGGQGGVQRSNLDGSNVLPFSGLHAPGIARLITPGLFVYYTVRGAASTTVFRAPLLSSGEPGAGAEASFEEAPGPLLSMTVVNGCLYYVDQGTPRQLLRKCSAAATAAPRYSGAGTLSFASRAANDATHLFFVDAARGLLRVPLDAAGDAEPLGDGSFGLPTVDTDALYYFVQTAAAPAGGCSSANALVRGSKEPGGPGPVQLLPAPLACPTQIAADETALYWTSGDGALLRLAK